MIPKRMKVASFEGLVQTDRCALTVYGDSYDGDEEDSTERSQAEGGEAVRTWATHSGGDSDWEYWVIWR